MVSSSLILSITALLFAENAASAALKKRDCGFVWPASAGDTCKSLASDWDITETEFIRWNNGVKCDALVPGQNYCLLWEGPEPTASASSKSSAVASATAPPVVSSTTTPAKPTTTTPSGPSPTQDGIASDCKSFYKVSSGDSCGGIVSKYGTFTLADFYKWNPAVGNTCSGLWLDYYVCVGVSSTPTTKPTTTAAPVPTSNAPGPVQEGIASDCQRYHEIVSGDQCAAIVSKYKTFTLQDFYKWNPGVGSNCQSLWLGYYVCIGVKGTPTQAPTTTAAPQPTSNKPSPTQPNVNKSCKKWYKVVSGDYCAKIATQFNISLTKFYGLNPDVGSNCGSLWLDYYVCVAN